MTNFEPTDEQVAIVEHNGPAFVSACPGAGKTRCIVERARKVLAKPCDGRGFVFLSFTNAAISELQDRLIADGLLPSPTFPHFVGTFDSFIWHYLVQPFGLEECDGPLRVIPDTGGLLLTPFPGAQALALNGFDRSTGLIIGAEANKVGFDRDPTRYETAARKLRTTLLQLGYLDFEDVRRVANANLRNTAFATRLGSILSARFAEIIVDEAQDCNPDDLLIIEWLRSSAKICTKVVCDPHQSIYGFRGGVSDDLFRYATTFPKKEQLPLTGNFRSSRHICNAVHTLRAPSQRGERDHALGKSKDYDVKITVLRYSGNGVSKEIGAAFMALAKAHRFVPEDCRLIAKTRSTGQNAIGVCTKKAGKSLSLKLANASMKFHHAETQKEQLDAITDAHIVALAISDQMLERTYHQVLLEDELDDMSWRGHIINVLRTLRFDAAQGHSRDEWIARARTVLGPLLPDGGGTIAQKLRNQTQLDDILGSIPTPKLRARTIHEVKGRQFPAVCVVLTTAKISGVLAHLEEEPDQSKAEDARELYVAASRAEKLLVFACPKSQASRFISHISSSGAGIDVSDI